MSQAVSSSRDVTASPSPGPGTGPVNKHAPTPLERQRMQLEKLWKDPSKPAHIPPPPKDKALRPPREMMKNVQGSSAGAGSGEFHVYKQNRRREYERIKIMEETAQKEAEAAEFEWRKRERDEISGAKTAKNRAKRQKKKAARVAAKKGEPESPDEDAIGERDLEAPSKEDGSAPVFKKRRLIGGDGHAMTFRGPGGEDEEDEDTYEGMMPYAQEALKPEASSSRSNDAQPIEPGIITIVDED